MRFDRCLHFAAFSGLLIGLTGCQLLQGMEEDRRIRLARADHEACVERGYDYPGPAYTECRMEVHDARLYEQWMELHMSLKQQAAAEPGNLPHRTSEPYRPLRIEDYRCEMRRDAESAPWIHCFEDFRARNK